MQQLSCEIYDRDLFGEAFWKMKNKSAIEKLGRERKCKHGERMGWGGGGVEGRSSAVHEDGR